MSTVIKAWKCIGCGKIEAPQTCIGVCKDRRIELVDAEEYRESEARERVAHDQMRALAAPLRLLVQTTPHEGVCLRSWQALQLQARALLSDPAIAAILDSATMVPAAE